MNSVHGNNKESLVEFGKAFDRAIVSNVVDEISSYMATDWVIIGTDGGITDKETFLDFIRSGDLLHEAMEFEDLRIALYDNTGVVTSKGTSRGTYRGQPFSSFEWTTSICIYDENGWRCVLTMLTPAK